MGRPFVVFSLPRSRSAWLAHFLSYPPAGKAVGHDTLVECKSMAEFLLPFDNGALAGTVETGAILGWRLIRAKMPRAKFVVLRRPVHEIANSLARFGIKLTEEELLARAGMLDAVARAPGTFVIDSSDLDDPNCAEFLFEELLEVEFDFGWWERCQRINIQVNMQERLDLLSKNYEQLERLKLEVVLATSKLGGESCLGLH